MALASSISTKAAPPHSRKVSAAGLEVHQSKMDFFCKLGYSKQDISKVLENLGQEALEDDVLRELIRMGSKPQALEKQAQPSQLQLMARGSCSTPAGLKWPGEDGNDSSSSLRPIVIDGSNVAMSHGNKEVFSCWGIQLAVDWFRERGHTYIKVFVPLWRKEPPRQDSPIADQHILEELEKQCVLVYTPSRKVKGRRVVCYDDRYIVKVAYERDGVIVSNDHYRDLQNENPEWKWFIEQRLLMYSFVSNRFMPPDDPLGRHGPTLSNFLSKKPVLPEKKWQPCPYGKKCTYGNKCKFYHPERQHQAQLSVADELRAKTKLPLALGPAEERARRSPLAARAEPAPCHACTGTLREASGCCRPCCCPGGSQGSCPEQALRAWASSPGSGRGLEQRSLLERVAAVSISRRTGSWCPSQHGDSPEPRAELGHGPLPPHPPGSPERGPCPPQPGALPAGPGPGQRRWAPQRRAGAGAAPGRAGTAPGRAGAAPGRAGTAPGRAGAAPGRAGTAPGRDGAAPGRDGTAPGRDGTAPGRDGTAPGRDVPAPGSRCTPRGAPHEEAPECRRPALLCSPAPCPGSLPRCGERQQRRSSPSQPFQGDPSSGAGLFQQSHAYHSASYRDYWPAPAARTPSARQTHTPRELCSPCPYSVTSWGMTLYPSIQDKGTGAL